MSAIEVYGFPLSTPARYVYVTLEVLKIPYKVKYTNSLQGDTRTPEFIKMNPQHNIPVVKDGDFVMNESRAIMTYLANKVGDEKWYPSDVKTRARVDQRLCFDMGSFYKAFVDLSKPVLFFKTRPTKEQIKLLKENFQWLNDFLKPTGFVAGTDHPTLADLSLAVSYSTIIATDVIDPLCYPELPPWFNKVKKTISNYEKANGEGVEEFGRWYKQKAREIEN